MMTDKIKSSIVSRNKKDPTQSYKSLNKTYRNIENRFYEIKLALKQLFDSRLIGKERDAHNSFIFQAGTIYQVNANYIYDISPQGLSTLLERIQDILDKHLLDGGSNDLWVFSAIEEEYRRGTHSAFTNLSYQSDFYSQQTTLSSLLARPAYLNQLQQAFILTYSDWKGFTEKSKSDLSSVIGNSIARGVNPRETAKVISKRLDICLTRAKTIAQTEQLGAYRDAQMNETEWSSERLGLKTGLLHQSALLPTSRTTHVYWHSKIRTVEEVRQWFAEDGNQFNCHCALTPVLLDENNEPYNKTAIERLSKERDKWFDDKKESIIKPKSPEQPIYTDKKTVKEVNEWAQGNITQVSKIPNGVDIDELNKCVGVVYDIQERFDMPKFRYVGSVSGDTYKYGRSKTMLAAYSPNTNALLVTKNSLKAEVLAKSDILSKTLDYKKTSLITTEYLNHKELTRIVNDMEYVPWHAVATPKGVFAHEMGHAIHNQYKVQINQAARKGWLEGWQYALSKYSQHSYNEFIAESFSLFIENKTEAKKRLYPKLFEFFNSIDKAK